MRMRLIWALAVLLLLMAARADAVVYLDNTAYTDSGVILVNPPWDPPWGDITQYYVLPKDNTAVFFISGQIWPRRDWVGGKASTFALYVVQQQSIYGTVDIYGHVHGTRRWVRFEYLAGAGTIRIFGPWYSRTNNNPPVYLHTYFDFIQVTNRGAVDLEVHTLAFAPNYVLPANLDYSAVTPQFAPVGLRVFVEGVSPTAGNTYAFPTLGADLFVGSDIAGLNKAFSNFGNLRIFRYPMIQSEVESRW